jgi:hypothetical protein
VRCMSARASFSPSSIWRAISVRGSRYARDIAATKPPGMKSGPEPPAHPGREARADGLGEPSVLYLRDRLVEKGEHQQPLRLRRGTPREVR